MNYDIVKFRAGFPGDSQPITRYENDRLSRSAILDIKLQQDSATAMEMVSVVIPLAVMPRFCRLLTQSNWVNTLELVLQFNHRAKESDQSRLLGYLGQARGLRQVVVTGAEPPWAAANTGLLMTHPYSEVVEILNTVSAYQNSSAHESNYGRTLAARNLIQDGVDFVDWWLDNIRSRMESIEDDEMDKLLKARADMGFSCASLSLRLGSIDLAQLAVEHVLQRLSSNERLWKIHKACAHYYMAQTFEAVGRKNAALYSYLQALRMRPGYREADLAVDQMERDLGSGSALEDAKVKHNIRNVLDPFRYQLPRSAVVSRRNYRTIFQEFDGTAAEIRSLDRDASGEVSRLHGKTADVFLIPHRLISSIWTPIINSLKTMMRKILMLGELIVRFRMGFLEGNVAGGGFRSCRDRDVQFHKKLIPK